MENGVAWKDMPVRDNDDYCLRADSLVPWEAIVYVALGQALSGNIQAMEWLRKAAYGNKLDVAIPSDTPNIANARKIVIEIKEA
jgi:hypothetical protein